MKHGGTAQNTKEKPAVRLYAGPTTAEVTARTEGFRFSRVAASYTLVYTEENSELPEGFIEISEEDANLLTADDRKWLTDCQSALIVEHIQEQKPEIIERLNELLNIMESIANTKEGGAEDGDNG